MAKGPVAKIDGAVALAQRREYGFACSDGKGFVGHYSPVDTDEASAWQRAREHFADMLSEGCVLRLDGTAACR